LFLEQNENSCFHSVGWSYHWSQQFCATSLLSVRGNHAHFLMFWNTWTSWSSLKNFFTFPQ
jgi:hypothetical protein